MRSFVDWLDKGPGFYVNKTWNEETQEFENKAGKITLFPHFRKIFKYVFTVDPETGRFPYRTVVISCVKKSGKTSIASAVGAWYAAESYPGTEIYLLAGGREHAEGRMMRAIQFDAKRTLPPECIHRYDIQYPNDTFIQVLSTHYTVASGANQALTLYDELWTYTTEGMQRLWAEMPPLPTEKLGLRVVVTYAGYEGESELLWDIYERTVLKGKRLNDQFPDLPCYTDEAGHTFVYWDREPRMPWQTPEYYEAEMVEQRPIEFRRLHQNEWGGSQDEFIPIEMWDDVQVLEAPLEYMPDSPYAGYPLYVGVDVGVKRDTSAICGVYHAIEEVDGVKMDVVGLAFHRIWTPAHGEILDLENTVEQYLKDMNKRFTLASIVCDPTHFYRSVVSLKNEGLPISVFSQSPKNMVAASMALYEALRFKRLKVYPDKELRNHIRFAAAKAQSGGYRIIKNPDTPRPNDGAIALAMAVYTAFEAGGADPTVEQVIRSPYGECTGLPHPPDEAEPDWMPDALRVTTR